MNKRYREAEFSSLTLPLGASDIYLSSLDDREFDTQKPSGNIELKKHEMIYNERGVVPGYSVGSDLACDFTNGIQSGKNMRSSNKSTSGWFGFSEREMTEQDRYELMALQLRNSTAPGKFYKNEQLFKKHHSKFNFGIVVDQNRAKTGLSDDSSTRRSNRSKSGMSLLHELIRDSETQKWANKKYLEIQKSKMKGAKKWYRMQVLRRKRF